MKWLITVDRIDTNAAFNRGTVLGSEAQAEFVKTAPFRFRLYDDDGGLYYEGVCDSEYFDPLDWAMTYSGATTMKIAKKGSDQWEVL